MLEAGFKYTLQNKLYIWQRREVNINDKREEEREEEERRNKREKLENSVRLGADKLRDLAWSLDVLDLSKHKNEKP
jgi:hypothetical protein